MPTPFMAGDNSHHYGNADYYYTPTPFINGAATMPIPMLVATTPAPAGTNTSTQVGNQYTGTPPLAHHPLPPTTANLPPHPPHLTGYYTTTTPPVNMPPPPPHLTTLHLQHHPHHPPPPPHHPPPHHHPHHPPPPPPQHPSQLFPQQQQPHQPQQQQPMMNPNIITIDQEYGDYLYQCGFKQGRFADTTIEVTQINKTFSLHAIILGRSPVFFGLLQQEQNKLNNHNNNNNNVKKTKKKYHITLDDLPTSVTEEVMTTVLSHLYRPMTIQDIMYLFARPRNLLAILDVADCLDIQSLTGMIYDALRHEWNFETISFWLPYLDQTTVTNHHPIDNGVNDHGKEEKESCSFIKKSSMSASMSFSIHYLTQTLPVQLESFYGDNYMDLAQVYSQLPLSLLEKCIEHEHLCVRDTMQRFDFAKKVIALRESMLEANDGVSVTLRFNNGEVSVKVIRP